MLRPWKLGLSICGMQHSAVVIDRKLHGKKGGCLIESRH